jgi:hypothetical protein
MKTCQIRTIIVKLTYCTLVVRWLKTRKIRTIIRLVNNHLSKLGNSVWPRSILHLDLIVGIKFRKSISKLRVISLLNRSDPCMTLVLVNWTFFNVYFFFLFHLGILMFSDSELLETFIEMHTRCIQIGNT